MRHWTKDQGASPKIGGELLNGNPGARNTGNPKKESWSREKIEKKHEKGQKF